MISEENLIVSCDYGKQQRDQVVSNVGIKFHVSKPSYLETWYAIPYNFKGNAPLLMTKRKKTKCFNKSVKYFPFVYLL